jgi:hypothetical protein
MTSKQLLPLLASIKHAHTKTYLDWINSVVEAKAIVKKQKVKVSQRLYHQKQKNPRGFVSKDSEMTRAEQTELSIIGCKIDQKYLAAHTFLLNQHEKEIKRRCKYFIHLASACPQAIPAAVEEYRLPSEALFKFIEMVQL